MATHREQLEKLRDLLWDRLGTAGARDAAGLAKQYRDTLTALEAMDEGRSREGSKADELAARRAQRLADTASAEGT